MLKFLIASALVVFSASFAGAQSADFNATSIPTKNQANTPAINNVDRTIFADQENKTFYIDFENLSVNLSNIVVKDVLGGVVFKDEVSGLPVDTIYELDMSRMAPGTYNIELCSYTGVIRKTITLP